jgi:Flp pilus assembly protein TadB
VTDEAQRRAAVVPEGERDALQRTAQATGERFGRQDEAISNHDQHFRQLNGSIARIDETTHTQATSLALLTASVSAIQKQLASRDEQGVRRVGLSTQWLIAIFGAVFAAFVAAAGMLVTIALALVALYASGKL